MMNAQSKFLDLFHLQLKKHVHETFEHVRKALDLREHLLSRQIDVFLNNTSPQQQPPTPPLRSAGKCNSGGGHPLQQQLKFMPLNETAVLENIRRLGKFNVDNYKFYTNPTFTVEDYICPNVDHDLMYKCLKQNGSEIDAKPSSNDVIRAAGTTTPNSHVDEVAGPMGQKSLNTDDVASNALAAAVTLPTTTSQLNPSEPSKSTKKTRKSKRKIKQHINCVAGMGAITINTINTICSRENSIKSKSNSKANDRVHSEPNSKDGNSNQVPHHQTSSSDVPLPNRQQTAASVVQPSAAPSTLLLTTKKSSSDMIMDSHSTMEITNRKQQMHHQSHNLTEFDRGDVEDGIDGGNCKAAESTDRSSCIGIASTNDYECSFYDRLLTDIRHSMEMATTTKSMMYTTPTIPTQMFSSSSCSKNSTLPLSHVSVSGSHSPVSSPACCYSTNTQPNESVLAISSAALSDMDSKSKFPNGVKNQIPDEVFTDQPVQIEEWLKQIGSEPELEPAPNTMFEHSLIHTG